MKKRVLSLFMALMLCLTLLPTAALAEEAGVVQDAANANSTYTTGDGGTGSFPCEPLRLQQEQQHNGQRS